MPTVVGLQRETNPFIKQTGGMLCWVPPDGMGRALGLGEDFQIAPLKFE
jgi:hypothetical protein